MDKNITGVKKKLIMFLTFFVTRHAKADKAWDKVHVGSAAHGKHIKY